MVGLKSRNPSLRCLVAIGGYNPALEKDWYTMAGNPTYRSNFARNVQRFLIANRLDGVGEFSWLSQKVLMEFVIDIFISTMTFVCQFRVRNL
jgi:hypothetical protein